MKKLIALLLCAALLVPALVGCSESAAESGSEESNAAANESAAEGAEVVPEEPEVTRANVPDSLPEGLDFGGTTLNILSFGSESCQTYDIHGELNGDVVLDAIYNRNVTVEDRLGVKLNAIAGSADWGGFPTEVQNALQSGSSDYDYIVEESSRLWQQSIHGYYYDFMNMNYIDLNQPWWYSEMMAESNLDNATRYFLNGDICLTVLFGASAMYVNKPLFTDYFGDVNALYESVLEGTWTYDSFADYCRGVYTDVNGDGQPDAGDIMGFRFEQWGIPNYLSMSTGLSYITRNDEGFPELAVMTEQGVKWGETLYKLLYTDNISMEGSKQDTFIAGKSLFYPGMFETAHALRDVEFEYGILPYPKLDDTVDYLSGAATANGCGVGIPITAPAEKLDAVCATIEALCAESYRKVVPAWYDTALKIKYSAGLIDAQMVDIIYEHIGSPFIMMADKELSIGSIYTSGVYGSNTDGAFASYYAKQEKVFKKSLERAIENYVKLKEEQ